MKTSHLPLLAAVLALAACSDSPTWDEDDPAGRMEFRISSLVRNGGFQAEGVQPDPSGAPVTEYASAMAIGPAVIVRGQALREGAFERAVISIPSRAKGRYAFTRPCLDATKCPGMQFFTSILSDGQTEPVSCFITSGSVTVTRASERRIAGTFSGTGECTSIGLSGSVEITVGRGSFETPVTGER